MAPLYDDIPISFPRPMELQAGGVVDRNFVDLCFARPTFVGK